MNLIRVDADDIRENISRIRALECAYEMCPGENVPYASGVTCLRCHSLQSLNFMLPEGERVEGISTVEECCVTGNDLCDTCYRSGVEISHTDANGNTVCIDCAEEQL